MTGWDRISRRYVVSGRVQGVGFRAFAARAARSLGISGGASNLDDGKVRIFASGPGHALDRFEAMLWQGPRLSRVEKVLSEDVTAESGEDERPDVEF